MAVQIQHRRGTAAAWTSANTVLAEGEIGFENDTNFIKIGDGTTAWTSLAYSSVVGAVTTATIDNDAVTNSKLANMTTKTYKGRTAGTTGDPEDVAVATLKTDLSLGNVDNTTDANKPVSTDQQTALDLKSNIASPTFTGTPAAPTASAATNTTQLATTAFVRTEVSNLVASAPGALDTLNELALALGSDANFSTTVTNSLALKANIAGPTFTGVASGATAAEGTKTTQFASTAFVGVALESDQNILAVQIFS